MKTLFEASPCILVNGFWPLDFGSLDWLLWSFTCGLPAWCLTVLLTLWAVLLLAQILLGRLVFLVSTSCNGGINSTVVLNLAMTPPCLTCCHTASLQLVNTAAFCLPLVDSQAKLSCNFGLPTATFSEDPLVCRCRSSHYRVVRPHWSIFDPASWWTIGCFLLALLVVGLGSPCS